MSWEALPRLAQAGFCTEVVLSASKALFGRALPQHPPLPAPTAQQRGEESFLPPPALQVMAVLMPEPAELPGRRESSQHLAGQHPDHGERDTPQLTSRATLGTQLQHLPNKSWLPNGVNVEAGAAKGIPSHQPKCSHTGRWWCMGLCGDSNTYITWGKCTHAEKTPQILLPQSLCISSCF